jgi:hypothetical protein
VVLRLDRYDWRYNYQNILLTYAVFVVLWPLLLIVPRWLRDPSDLFPGSDGADKARLLDHPPPCGALIRYRQLDARFEKAFGKFLFPAEAVEGELMAQLRDNPHLRLDDEGGILNWVRRRNTAIHEPTDVPAPWRRFKFIADNLVRAGKGKVHCSVCDETYPTGALVTADNEGKWGWVINKLACPRGHKLLVVERAHFHFRPGFMPPDAPHSTTDYGWQPRFPKRTVSSLNQRLTDEDKRIALAHLRKLEGSDHEAESTDQRVSASEQRRSDSIDARARAAEFMERRYGESISIVPVESLPSPVYGFDPTGWRLFAVLDRKANKVGGTRYVAVSESTGEVRDLGHLGE